MCKVDRKTITHVNNCMIAHVKKGSIHVMDTRDGKIIVPVHLLGSRQYSMSIDRVNEIYGQARRSVVGSTAHKK
jgi:glucose dehydrogenase